VLSSYSLKARRAFSFRIMRRLRRAQAGVQIQPDRGPQAQQGLIAAKVEPLRPEDAQAVNNLVGQDPLRLNSTPMLGVSAITRAQFTSIHGRE